MCRRQVFERALPRMCGRGFKVLLDLLASSPEPPRVLELPYSFRRRQRGKSKLDVASQWQFAMQLLAEEAALLPRQLLLLLGAQRRLAIGVFIIFLKETAAIFLGRAPSFTHPECLQSRAAGGIFRHFGKRSEGEGHDQREERNHNSHCV